MGQFQLTNVPFLKLCLAFVLDGVFGVLGTSSDFFSGSKADSGKDASQSSLDTISKIYF